MKEADEGASLLQNADLHSPKKKDVVPKEEKTSSLYDRNPW